MRLGVKPKGETYSIVDTRICWNKCLLNTEAFQLKKEGLVSQLQEAYAAKDSKRLRAGRGFQKSGDDRTGVTSVDYLRISI